MNNDQEKFPSIIIKNLGKSYDLFKSNIDRILNSIVPFNYSFKNHTTFWVIRGLNLEINKGDRIAIIGENGAGKSTLLKILSSTVPPTEGEVEIYGKIEALLQSGVGFHPDLTGRENIHAFFAYKNISQETLALCEHDIAEFTELGDFLDQPISSYSLGMLARLSFAVATCVMPEILIVDEVLGAGDAYFFGKSLERMKNFTQNKNSTVLFVSHDLNVLQKLCNRAIWIHQGEILADGAPSDVVKSYLDYIDFRTENRHKAHEFWNRSKALQKFIPSGEVYRSHILCIQPEVLTKSFHQLKINKISLYNNESLISNIYPGKARDNDNSNRGYLVEGRDTGWKEPRITEGFNYRELNLKLNKYSPFMFKENICAWSEKSALKIKIFHSPVPKDIQIAVKYWRSESNSYETIGYLNTKANDSNLVVSEFEYHLEPLTDTTETQDLLLEDKQIVTNDTDVENTQAVSQTIEIEDTKTLPNDISVKQEFTSDNNNLDQAEDISEQFEYSQDSPIKIDQVSFINANGENKRVLIAGETLQIRINYKISQSVLNPVFAITFHSIDGTQMDHKNTALAGINLGELTKDGHISFNFNPLRIGPGEYLVSIAILKYLEVDNWLTIPPAYDRHNRGYRLTILPKPELRIALGTVIQECQIIPD